MRKLKHNKNTHRSIKLVKVFNHRWITTMGIKHNIRWCNNRIIVILRNGDHKTWQKTEDAQMFSFSKHKKIDSRNWRLISIILKAGKIIEEIKHIFYQQFFQMITGR